MLAWQGLGDGTLSSLHGCCCCLITRVCIIAGKGTPCCLGQRKSPSPCQTVGHQAVSRACGQLEFLQYAQVCKGKRGKQKGLVPECSKLLPGNNRKCTCWHPWLSAFSNKEMSFRKMPSEIRLCWLHGWRAVNGRGERSLEWSKIPHPSLSDLFSPCSLNKEKRRQDLERVWWENQQLLKRLEERKSELAQEHWQQAWYKEELLRNNISCYPRSTGSCQVRRPDWSEARVDWEARKAAPSSVHTEATMHIYLGVSHIDHSGISE